jgi:hypothetical protein
VEGNNWAPPTPAPAAPIPKRPWWRRRWVLISAGAVSALVAVGLVAPKDGSSSVHTGDTSAAAATTQIPTTIAPTTSTSTTTEAATTAPPTTAEPTTVAPTEPSTTLAPPPASTEPAATTIAPAPPTPTAVVTQVIDGDTIVIDTSEHIRFIGIDTRTGTLRLLRGDRQYAEHGVRQGGHPHRWRPRRRRQVRAAPPLRDLRDGIDTGLAQITGGFAVARYDSRDGYGHHAREEQYVAADTGAAAPCIVTPPSSAPAPAPTAPKAPATTTPSGGSVYYANCAAARAAGVAPLHRGEPGYRAGLDRDNDGIACE